jgi:hypothetical protein
MTEAYSDEVSSCGYWPGGATEGIFYSYAYPEPPGFRTAKVAPEEGYFDEQLAEFVLPYAAVRTAANPDVRLRQFLETTFRAARGHASWPMAIQG